MNCSKCGHPTNHKSGICIACTIDEKFKAGNSAHIADTHLDPASRSKRPPKHQGNAKGHTGSVLSKNPYLLDDLQLLILAQVGYIFDLAKEGKLKQAVKRIQLTSEALKNAKR